MRSDRGSDSWTAGIGYTRLIAVCPPVLITWALPTRDGAGTPGERRFATLRCIDDGSSANPPRGGAWFDCSALPGFLANLGPSVPGLFDPTSRTPISSTFGTVRTSGTCSTCGRRNLGRGRPPRRPLVVFFHGGGFRSGDKSSIPAWLVSSCLDAGISVASANYRLSQTAPFPAPMLDGARAIQFVRFKANELGIDPAESPHPAARPARGSRSGSVSTTTWPIPAVMTRSPGGRRGWRAWASTAHRPRTTRGSSRSLIGGRAHEHPALRAFFGITSDAELDSPRSHKLYEEASPLSTTSSADDPPVFLFTPSPTHRSRPTPSRGRGSITLASARRSRPSFDPLGSRMHPPPLQRLLRAR